MQINGRYKLGRIFASFVFLCALCASAVTPSQAAQNDYSLRTTGAPYTGTALIGDINTAFQALASNNSGAAPPPTIYPFMTWMNTASGTVDMWDGVQWVPIGTLNVVTHTWTPSGLFTSFNAVTSSRAANTTYTNTTGKPMFVTISFSSAGNSAVVLNVNGQASSQIVFPAGGANASLYAMVPAGSTYELLVFYYSVNIGGWAETY